MSPLSDIVGPSPVTSNGTETTEIEDDEIEDAEEHRRSSVRGKLIQTKQLSTLKTNLPDHVRRSMGEEVVSVIHAPPSFKSWVRRDTTFTTGDGFFNRANLGPLQTSSDTASKSSLSNSVGVGSPENSASPPPSEHSTIVRNPIPWRLLSFLQIHLVNDSSRQGIQFNSYHQWLTPR